MCYVHNQLYDISCATLYIVQMISHNDVTRTEVLHTATSAVQ